MPCGESFGGGLGGHKDMAAGWFASRQSKGRAGTVAVEGMKVHHPVFVGDDVSVFAHLVRVGTTSMTIDVEAWRRARHSEESHRVTQAKFVRSEEHTSELQSLMRISYAVFCLKKKYISDHTPINHSLRLKTKNNLTITQLQQIFFIPHYNIETHI